MQMFANLMTICPNSLQQSMQTEKVSYILNGYCYDFLCSCSSGNPIELVSSKLIYNLIFPDF